MIAARGLWRRMVLATLAATGLAAHAMPPLLLTPAERAEVERLRRLPPEVAATAPAEAVAAPRSRSATVQGWVLRRDGRSTVWVDNEAFYGFEQEGPTREALRRRGLFAPPGASQRPGQLRAGPGQTQPAPGAAPADLLPPGAIQIHPGGADAAARRP